MLLIFSAFNAHTLPLPTALTLFDGNFLTRKLHTFSLQRAISFPIEPLFTQQKGPQASQLSITRIVTENMLIISRPLTTVAVNNKNRNLFNVIAMKPFIPPRF